MRHPPPRHPRLLVALFLLVLIGGVVLANLLAR